MLSEKYYTVPQVAEMICLSRSTAYRLVARGEIPSVRVSQRRIIIPETLLTKYLALRIYGNIFEEAS